MTGSLAHGIFGFVKSISYEFPSEIRFDALLTRLVACEDRIARLDERLRTLPFSAGFAERLLYSEACAVLHAERCLVHQDDLVLLDGGAFSGAMSPELSSAWHLLGVWRKALRGDARRLLSSDSPGEDSVGARQAGPMDVPHWGEAERLAAWRGVLRKSAAFPPLLAAALVADAWLVLEPEQRRSWKAWLLAALVFKARGKCAGWLLPMAAGVRHSKSTRQGAPDFATRIGRLIDCAVVAVARSEAELQRLRVAEGLMRAKILGRRAHCRAAELIDLLLARPIVSVSLAAKTLRCSRQAVAKMLPMLGSAPREMTGNKRYRVWMV